MNKSAKIAAGCALVVGAAVAVAELGGAAFGQDADKIARGRYVAVIGGCNDCHTAGYAMNGGQVPEDQWLLGDVVGWQGPWGTTYPANLRGLMATLTEDEWVTKAQTLETRPPMPWFNVRAMTEEDQRALYAFIRSLPENATPAPDYVPPGGTVVTPYYDLGPHEPG